jgi:two-component system sensor histidine kinase/response regulator
VLVADDRAKSRSVLSAILERLGAAVQTESSGQGAIAAITNASFDLLLLDAQMPGVDGFEVARFARKLPQPPEIVMMLGASDLHSDAAESRQLGVDQYVMKPVNESELVAAVYRTLYGSGKQPAAVAPAVPREVRTLSVLLAEDNTVNQKLATRLLEKMGHRVTLAVNGAEAARAHAAEKFDLVLMDVQMPEMNGFEATARIRERERITGEHVPIVALTAHAIRGDRERCLAAGMDDYLSKPLNASALAAKLEILESRQFSSA